MVPAVRLISINETHSYWGLGLEEIKYMEELLDEVPPMIKALPHHELIKRSFIFTQPTPPHFAGRFKPPAINLNVLYASAHIRASVHEAVYYFLKERVNINFSAQSEKKLAFGMLIDVQTFHDVRNHADVQKMMSKTSYAESHNYYLANQGLDGVIYPSCRYTHRMNENFAVMNINKIDPNLNNSDKFEFSFIYPDTCHVTNLSRRIDVKISWAQVR